MKTLFTKPIIIQLHPSSLLLGLLLAVATLSSLILLTLPFSLRIKIAFFALIIVSTVYFIARDALLMLPFSWSKIEVNAKGELTVVNKRKQRYKPQLAASSFVHEFCIILNFKNQGLMWAISPVLIFNNGHNVNALRRLRVWLRLYKNKRSKETYQHITQLTVTTV